MKSFNLTIKKLVYFLFIFGVLVIASLAVVSSLSNQKLINSQRRVTDIVIPLESANQKIRVAMAEFTERQSRITRVSDIAELNRLKDRSILQSRYDNSRNWLITLFIEDGWEKEQLRRLLSENQEVFPETSDQDIALINKLNTRYIQFLKKDAAILDAVQFRIETEMSLRQKITELDNIGKILKEKAEKIAGQIRFAGMQERVAVREYIGSGVKDDELHKAVMELLKGDLTKPREACNLLLIGVASLATHSREILLAGTPNAIGGIQKNLITAAYINVSNALKQLTESVKNSDATQQIIAGINDDFFHLKEILEEIVRLRKQWFEQEDAISKIEEALRLQAQSINNVLTEFESLGTAIRQQAKVEANDVRKFAERMVWITAIVAAGLMCLVGIAIARRIVDPIEHAASFADTIAQGDLTAQINVRQSYFLSRFYGNGQDEIGMLVFKLSEMARSLNSLISQVQRSGVQVSSSSTELAATARQQEAIMASQSKSTTNVIKSLEEITEISADLVETMQQVSTMSGETAEFATLGQEDLSRMEAAIHRMETASSSISAKLEAINEKATNITSVVTTITKVADQTNLLSLNAAIEAEKAGEQGRGFTVVAREIRRLADQTAVATLDIEQMVRDMQSAVSAGVMEMDAFIKEVQHSAKDVSSISEQLNRIILQVQNLSPSFDNVNASMQIQSENAKTISESMTRLGEDLQQTLDSFRESFVAIDQLSEAAVGLQDEVSRFTV